jgi:hypothetical protein
MLGPLTEPLRLDEADAVFGSRMLIQGEALNGGMPLYKYVGNRILTTIQNRLLGTGWVSQRVPVYAVSALKASWSDSDGSIRNGIIVQSIANSIKTSPPTCYGKICRVDGLKYAFDVLGLPPRLVPGHQSFYDRRFGDKPAQKGRRYPQTISMHACGWLNWCRRQRA